MPTREEVEKATERLSKAEQLAMDTTIVDYDDLSLLITDHAALLARAEAAEAALKALQDDWQRLCGIGAAALSSSGDGGMANILRNQAADLNRQLRRPFPAQQTAAAEAREPVNPDDLVWVNDLHDGEAEAREVK